MKRFRNTDYYVNDIGEVYSDKNKRFKLLKPNILNSGYLQYSLFIEGKRINILAHRIIAECYLPDYNNNLQVNHINGDKKDNRIFNLEMNTSKENISNYKKSIGEKPYIFKVTLNKKTILLDTLKEVADYCGYKSRGSVYNPLVSKDEHKTNKGYIISRYYL